MNKGVKTNKRAERKAREVELIREWTLMSFKKIKDMKDEKDKDICEVILVSHFESFCILNHINGPEDRDLRNRIIRGASELLKLIKEQAEKKGKNEEDKK